MKYYVLGDISSKLLHIAYYNKNDIFVIPINNFENKEKYKDKTYCLNNIIFDEVTEDLDGIVWDGISLSIGDINELNKYLEVDKPAYVGNIYCDELENLWNYEPFMGNSSIDLESLKEKPNNKSAIVIKQDSITITLDFIDKLFEMDYKVLTLGDFNKLVDNDKIICYYPSKDKNIEIDIKNLERLMKSDNIAFIPNLNINDGNMYYIDLIEEFVNNYNFDEKILLTTVQLAQAGSNYVKFNEYDKILVTDRLFNKDSNILEYINYGMTNLYKKELKDNTKVFFCDYIGNEFVNIDNPLYEFSVTYRKLNPQKWENPYDHFNVK